MEYIIKNIIGITIKVNLVITSGSYVELVYDGTTFSKLIINVKEIREKCIIRKSSRKRIKYVSK